MFFSSYDHIRGCLPFLPQEFVGTDKWKILELYSQKLPFLSLISIEVPLNRPQVDFDIALCAVSFEEIKSFANSPDLPQGKAWTDLKNFSREIEVENSFLQSYLNYIWINIDLKGVEIGSLDPWFYLTFKANKIIPEFWEGILRKTYQYFIDDIESADLFGDSWLSLLPQKSRVYGMGLLRYRGIKAIRYVVFSIDPNEILAFLRSMDWRGNLGSVSDLFQNLEGIPDRYGLIFDIDESGIRDKIGIEVYLPKNKNYQAIARLLEKLEEVNMVSGFPGFVSEQWPGCHYSEESEFERWYNHIKIVYSSDSPPELKLYLGSRKI